MQEANQETRPAKLSAKDRARGLYRTMLLIRRFEEESARAYAQGKIGGFLHLYIGQEAIAAGAVDALEHRDYIVTTYRDHGFALARGMTARACMAELFGRETGCSRGLGGSMHMFDRPNNFLGGHGIVGGHIPLAAGTAFASKYKRDGRVTICLFGDGATNIQGFHEGISLAALWKLPVIFIVENNEYSMGTPLSRTLPQIDLVQKAPGYNIPGLSMQGQDVLEVAKALKEPIDRARRGEGPTFIEIKTYRYRGHSMSDPGKYRTPEEVEEKKKLDPVRIGREHAIKNGISEAELTEVDASVEAEVQDALTFADASPLATPEAVAECIVQSSLVTASIADTAARLGVPTEKVDA